MADGSMCDGWTLLWRILHVGLARDLSILLMERGSCQGVSCMLYSSVKRHSQLEAQPVFAHQPGAALIPQHSVLSVLYTLAVLCLEMQNWPCPVTCMLLPACPWQLCMACCKVSLAELCQGISLFISYVGKFNAVVAAAAVLKRSVTSGLHPSVHDAPIRNSIGSCSLLI